MDDITIPSPTWPKQIKLTDDGEVFVEHGETKTKISIDPKIVVLICAATVPQETDRYADELLELEKEGPNRE